MSEKRFKTKYYLKSRQGVVLGVVKVNEEENVLHWNEVVDLLNELNEENQELKRLIKKMGELGGFNKHLIKTICEDLE